MIYTSMRARINAQIQHGGFLVDQALTRVIEAMLNGPIYVKLFAIAIAAIYTLVTSLRFVRESHLGLKLRFGKVVRYRSGVHAGQPKVIHPGFCFLIPHVDTLIRHPVRQQTIKLNDQKVTLKDNTIWIVSAACIFKIDDIYKALFEINDVDLGVFNAAATKLREVLQNLDSAEDLKDIKRLNQLLLAAMETEETDWGIKMISFRLVDCAPDASTARFITAQAMVKMNIDALKTAGIDPLENPVLAGVLLGSVQLVSDVKKANVVVSRRTIHDGAGNAVDRLS